MPKGKKEIQTSESGLVRAAVAVVCIVITVFGIFSNSQLSSEHEDVHRFEMAKYENIRTRHLTNMGLDPNKYRSSSDVAGGLMLQNERGIREGNEGKRERINPKDGPVDWANVPCNDMSLDGRKFLVVSFVDEQVCSRF